MNFAPSNEIPIRCSPPRWDWSKRGCATGSRDWTTRRILFVRGEPPAATGVDGAVDGLSAAKEVAQRASVLRLLAGALQVRGRFVDGTTLHLEEPTGTIWSREWCGEWVDPSGGLRSARDLLDDRTLLALGEPRQLVERWCR